MAIPSFDHFDINISLLSQVRAAPVTPTVAFTHPPDYQVTPVLVSGTPSSVPPTSPQVVLDVVQVGLYVSPVTQVPAV